jgi:hypothetical protein
MLDVARAVEKAGQHRSLPAGKDDMIAKDI